MQARIMVAAAAVVGMIAGCGGGSDESGGPGFKRGFGAAGGATAQPADEEETQSEEDVRRKPGPTADGIDLRDELLPIADLIEGFTLDLEDDDDGVEECLDATEDVDYDATAYAEVSYARGDSAGLYESIGYYREPGAAEDAFDEVVAVVERCGTMTIGGSQVPIEDATATVLGDEAVSYLVNFAGEGTAFQIRLGLVRSGSRLLALTAYGSRVGEDGFAEFTTRSVFKLGS